MEDERIVATMGIINDSTGATNYMTDDFNEYNGRIEIKTPNAQIVINLGNVQPDGQPPIIDEDNESLD